MITLVSRDSRKIIGYDIAYDKSTERIQAVIDSSPKADDYHSDGYQAYQEVYYHGKKHHVHYHKSETYTVEGINSDLRKYIPFLQRKSKCFLRSLDTAKSVLKIFVYAYNQFGEAKRPTMKCQPQNKKK